MLAFTMSEQPDATPPSQEALRELRDALHRLHLTAGKPSGREISRQLGGLPSHTTVSSVLRCDKACKWWQLEPIIEHLNGDVENFRRLWMATQRDSGDSADAVTVTELSQEAPETVSAPIKFRQFVPADLGNGCVLPHALDDQWVPRGQLRLMQADGASLKDLGELRSDVIRREYVRSLITAERIIINRSFLFRNPVLSAGYTTGIEGRNAFTELLRDGAIVLFLTKELSPLDSDWAKESAVAREAATALEPILRSVRAWCVRLSWGRDNDELIDAWNARFGERIKRAIGMDHGRFLKDTGATSNDIAGFRQQLDLLPRLATPAAQVPITRSNLYAEYIVRDPQDIAPGRYDFTKPYLVPLKWLFDLVYNSNLATELQLAMTTPVDSVHRSVVHNPNFFQDEVQGDGFHPGRVRAAIMETIQSALFRRDFSTGALSVFEAVTLPQVVTIRRSEPWRAYTDAVNALLAEPWLLSHPERGILHVYRLYDDLISYIRGRVTP